MPARHEFHRIVIKSGPLPVCNSRLGGTIAIALRIVGASGAPTLAVFITCPPPPAGGGFLMNRLCVTKISPSPGSQGADELLLRWAAP